MHLKDCHKLEQVRNSENTMVVIGEQKEEKEECHGRLARRTGICDEIERKIFDENGANLREFRKLLVTHLMLRELQLL